MVQRNDRSTHINTSNRLQSQRIKFPNFSREACPQTLQTTFSPQNSTSYRYNPGVIQPEKPIPYSIARDPVVRSDPALVSLSQTMATFSPEKESCSGDRKSGIVWLVCSITYTLTRLLGSHCLLLPHMTFPIPILFLTSPTFWIRSENQKLQEQKNWRWERSQPSPNHCSQALLWTPCWGSEESLWTRRTVTSVA